MIKYLPIHDITQITLRSELLSQIRGLDVVLRDQSTRTLGLLNRSKGLAIKID